MSTLSHSSRTTTRTSAVTQPSFIVVIVVVVVVSLSPETSAACNASSLVMCYRDFANLTASYARPNSYGAALGMTSVQGINEFCMQLEAVVRCFESTDCHSIQGFTSLLQSLKRYQGYLCTDRKQELLLHQACLESSQVKSSGVLCAEQEYLLFEEENGDCEKSSRALTCYMGSIARCCGPGARSFMEGLIERITSSSLSPPGSASSSIGGCYLQSNLTGVDIPAICVSDVLTETRTTLAATTTTPIDRSGGARPSGEYKEIMILVAVLHLAIVSPC